VNLLFSCIGRRGYIADYFRTHLSRGDLIIGTSNSPWTPGFHACDRSYVLPDIASGAYIPAVKDVCRREKIDAILSFFDPDAHALSRHIHEFKELGITAFIPEPAVCDASFDKLESFRFLSRSEIATALTCASLQEAYEALRQCTLSFPVYVKPRYGFASRNIFLAADQAQMETFFDLEPHMLVQERLEGDEYDVDVCNGLDGSVLSVVPWRKRLSRLGETEQAQTCRDRELIDAGLKLGEALGHTGPLDADLVVKDGIVSVLEFNLRFGGGYPVSHLAGADFPGILVDLLKGNHPPPRIGEFQDNVVMMKSLNVIGGANGAFFETDLHITGNLRNDHE